MRSESYASFNDFGGNPVCNVSCLLRSIFTFANIGVYFKNTMQRETGDENRVKWH